MNKPKIIFKKCKDDNITVHPHCNSIFCSQKILEINPAIGCEFQCQYCCLYTQESENKFYSIIIYEDYPEMLENYISNNWEKLKEKYTFFFSFESDCFQKELLSKGITQKILKILLKYELKYFILTKGGLPEEAGMSELLIESKKIGQVIVNDTMPNELYRNILEPYTATNKDRFNLVKFCIINKIPVTVSFSPIFPFGNLEYLEEKIKKYSEIGIDHFRLDMLELSLESYNKLIQLLPSHKNELEHLYKNDSAVENKWKVPNSTNTVLRYKPSEKYMSNAYNNLMAFAKSINPNATVSICDAVIACNTSLNGFNKEAYACGYNCMGVKHN